MSRLIIILTILFSFSQTLFAQKTSEEQIKDEVYKVIREIRTLQCDFVQTKSVRMLAEKSVSYGSMAYQHDKKLRWEYKKPFAHIFILNETQVLIQDKDGREIIDVEKSRIFKEVVKMIKGDVIGESFNGGKTFAVSCSAVDNEYVAVLTTQNKRLKQMFAQLTLHIDKDKKVLTGIEISSAKGDVTMLSFQNVVVNAPVDDTLFAIN